VYRWCWHIVTDAEPVLTRPQALNVWEPGTPAPNWALLNIPEEKIPEYNERFLPKKVPDTAKEKPKDLQASVTSTPKPPPVTSTMSQLKPETDTSKPATVEPENAKKKQQKIRGDLEVIQLPITTAAIGQILTPVMTVYYCGTCAYPEKHRYILLENGTALLSTPVCKECNNLNLAVVKTIEEMKKQTADKCL